MMKKAFSLNEELQALYDELVKKWCIISWSAKVGGLVEEVDILDLEKAIGQTDKRHQIDVSESLKASLIHLSAFSSNYQNQTDLVTNHNNDPRSFEEAISIVLEAYKEEESTLRNN